MDKYTKYILTYAENMLTTLKTYRRNRYTYHTCSDIPGKFLQHTIHGDTHINMIHTQNRHTNTYTGYTQTHTGYTHTHTIHVAMYKIDVHTPHIKAYTYTHIQDTYTHI